MAILGLKVPLPKAGGGSIGSTLNFEPDRLILINDGIVNNIISQYRRSDITGTNHGLATARLNADLAQSSFFPEDGKIKHWEIRVRTNSIITSNDFYFNIEGVEGANTITILVGQSGTFIDTTETSFNQGDYVMLQVDRNEDASGGLSLSQAIIGITFDT